MIKVRLSGAMVRGLIAPWHTRSCSTHTGPQNTSEKVQRDPTQPSVENHVELCGMVCTEPLLTRTGLLSFSVKVKHSREGEAAIVPVLYGTKMLGSRSISLAERIYACGRIIYKDLVDDTGLKKFSGFVFPTRMFRCTNTSSPERGT